MSPSDFMWSDLSGPGMEHLTLVPDDEGYVADGLYMGRNEESLPYRLHYVIRINDAWEMQSATLALLAGPQSPQELSVTVDDACSWRDANGETLAELAGCREIDLLCSSFTKSLAIRRLGLSNGESAEISVAYVDVPAMRLSPVRQRYTCLEPLGPQGGLYRYEPLFYGDARELQVDSDGLVTDYPGTFCRVFAA